MRESKRLSLKREALTELSNDELSGLAGGNQLTDVCVGNTNVVCVTVGYCITDYCHGATKFCLYTALCK